MKKELRKYAKALFQSILENNLTRCQHILEKVNDKAKKQIILELDDEGFMPIHIAAGLNHSRIVELLLEQHNQENINIYAHGYTALHLAAAKGYDRIVYLLCKFGCKIDLINEEGDTALISASRLGFASVVSCLIENKANVNKQSITDGESPLFAASSTGNFLVVKQLLNTLPELNLDAVNIDGATSLLVSSQNGHLQCVQQLIANGADVNCAKNDGATAIFMASQEGHLNIVEALLSSKVADVEKQNKYKSTPLLVASLKGHFEIVNLLLTTGKVNSNHKENGNITAAMLAAEMGHVKILKLLITAGANLRNVYRNDHRNAFQIAITSKQVDVVRFIVTNMYSNFSEYDKEKKRKILKEKLISSDGNTILLDCIQYGDIHICELIIEHFCLDVDECNKKTGEFPLTLATELNKAEMVTILLKYTKNVNVKRKKTGSSPLLIACSKGLTKIVELLLSYDGTSNATELNDLNSTYIFGNNNCISGNDRRKRNLLINAPVFQSCKLLLER